MITWLLLSPGPNRRRRASWRLPLLLLALVGLTGGACASEASKPASGGESDGTGDSDGLAETRICDGSQSLRLAVRAEPGGLVQYPLFYEIGAFYVYVRGDCRYWVRNEVSATLHATHTGTLDAAYEQALTRDLHYSEWTVLSEQAYGALGAGDTDVFVYSDGRHAIYCDGWCGEGGVFPTELANMDEAFRRAKDELWSMGEPMGSDDPLRIALLRRTDRPPADEDPGYACLDPWPLSWDPDVYAIPHDGGERPSTLVFEPDHVTDLRSMRLHYLDRAAEEGPCDPIGESNDMFFYDAAEPTTHYTLVMRDTVPFEDGEGRVLLPPPPT